MSGMTSAKLYVQVAILRHRVLLHQAIRRALAGALAVVSFVVATGLSTYVFYLSISPRFGELLSVLVIAAIYLALAIILVFYTFHEPKSAELDALTDMEAATLEAALMENRDIIHALGVTGRRIQDVGNTVALSLGVLSSLRKLMASKNAGV